MARIESDRNLLYGILAVQMNFISRDALIEAMNAWVIRRSQPLGEILVEQGKLTPERHALLNALITEQLRANDGDPLRSLAAAELGAVSSLCASIAAQVDDGDVQASLAAARFAKAEARTRAASIEAPAADPHATQPSAAADDAVGGRFRIVRPHAQGGLGEVFVAVDQELSREVALKKMKPRQAAHPDSRTRFVLEAEITGGLEHPGIVPVYSLGHQDGGFPFYAMRFIRGDTLRAAISRFHRGAQDEPGSSPPASDPPGSGAQPAASRLGSKAENPASPASRALEFRDLLRRLVDVCNAVAYAHSRGVLHRDLKPENIMLGKYGETLVVDWGLAKPTGRAERPASLEAEAALQPSSASATPQTLPGSALGTPQYMSPEQAAGRLDLLTPASDVYSLGATLYCLLTDSPPVTGDDLGEILRRVQHGEISPPRALVPAVPKALEAICCKALALEPGNRYGTAKELADDLERWLADEPVSAYPEPLFDRTRRWMRTHRTIATSAAAVLLMGAVAMGAVATVVDAKNRQLDSKNRQLVAANKALDDQRKRAEDREQTAIDAVKRFRDAVSGNTELKNNPALDSLRRALLKEPLAFFRSLRERLFADSDTRPDALARLAAASFDLANLTADIGDREDALRASEESLAIYQRLAQASPQTVSLQKKLAETRGLTANLLHNTGRSDRAEAEFRRAIAEYERLAQQAPNDPEPQNVVARLHNILGGVYRDLARMDEAIAEHEQALRIAEPLAERHPDVPQFQESLDEILNDLAYANHTKGQLTKTMELLQRSAAISERLAQKYPKIFAYQAHLATSYNNLAIMLRRAGKTEEGLDSVHKAEAIVERMVRENPSVSEYQRNLANAYSVEARFHEDVGNQPRALACRVKVIEIHERLVRENPRVPTYTAGLAGAHHGLGEWHRKQAHADEAIKCYQKAEQVWKALIKEHPTVPEYKQQLAGALTNIAAMEMLQGRRLASLGHLQEAVKYWKDPFLNNPGDPYYTDGLMETPKVVSEILRSMTGGAPASAQGSAGTSASSTP